MMQNGRISHPLEGNLLLSYKPLHLEAQQRLQEEGCVVDINLACDFCVPNDDSKFLFLPKHVRG